MQNKRRIQMLWMLISLVLVIITIATPSISPLSTPLREKECKDQIINADVCKFNRHVRTYCCLSQMLFDCKEVEEWVHKTDGTYHYRNPTGCNNLEIACSPYNNHCD
jgi:hypothetical protein